ncbi:LysR family transcriptional regulator substrate-binding protein [Streptomyces reniochalinae]|uniref:LysR family transcriptional regulator n=1 Tax=Streptomyces reniochalinae TaxID=2250578 RepID=A0A367EQ79_9ACTN|nr:LysR family transcriptional regulator substrate-binding protein [Streptomyces reniochalinae]RCG20266.1 LysR family transcriptional regulator [Streptomyces reniochalinae]
MTGSETSPSFTVAFVPGVTPTKWVRIWEERLPDVPLRLAPVTAAEAPGLLRDGGADAGFVRLPVDREYFSAIPLYTEKTVVVVPKDHLVTAADEVTTGDLADDILLHPLDDVLGWEEPPGRPARERPATTADAVELVAAGVGLLVVPQSLARLHHRRDLTYRTVTDAPTSQVALAWPEERTTDGVEDFIGIVRGRTVNSTRGRKGPEAQPKQKRSDKPAPRRKPTPGRAGGRTARGGGGGRGAQGGGSRRGKPRRP